MLETSWVGEDEGASAVSYVRMAIWFATVHLVFRTLNRRPTVTTVVRIVFIVSVAIAFIRTVRPVVSMIVSILITLYNSHRAHKWM